MLNIYDKSNLGRNGNKCWLPALAGFVQHRIYGQPSHAVGPSHMQTLAIILKDNYFHSYYS